MIDNQEWIRRHLDEAGAVRTDGAWWIYHGFVTPDNEAPVEVCVPFTGTVDPSENIVIRLEPAHTEAYCTVSRDDCYFPQIMSAYDVLRGWVARQRREPTGPPREVYLAHWCDIDGTDPFVHVAQPIQDQPTQDQLSGRTP